VSAKTYQRRCPSCRKKMHATRDRRGYVLRWVCAKCPVIIENFALNRNDRSQRT
jgi:ribosomal protein L37AE/L43A